MQTVDDACALLAGLHGLTKSRSPGYARLHVKGKVGPNPVRATSRALANAPQFVERADRVDFEALFQSPVTGATHLLEMLAHVGDPEPEVLGDRDAHLVRRKSNKCELGFVHP